MLKRQLTLETFEDRAQPATFGIPWFDPRLSLSFAPDGTTIAGRTSDLFEGLGQSQSTEEWQRDILKAYQLWTSQTNLSVAVVPDDGSSFGTAGRSQGDPRFGDIRFAGNRLSPDVLAVTSPPDPALAGTLAGDVFVNTSYRFDGSPYDLSTVILHEAGHSLGLNHSTNPASPMFPQFNNTKPNLTSGDIQAIRTLYGSRTPDRHEGTQGNSTTATARAIPTPPGYLGATPLLVYGDLTKSTDIDTYSFLTPAVPQTSNDDDDTISIRLQSSGLSLVAPKVTVYFMEAGNMVEVANATASPDDFDGDTIELSFDGSYGEVPRKYFVRVEPADGADFSVGKYALAVSFDERSTTPVANLDRVITGPYVNLTPNDLARLLKNPDAALVNLDNGTNNTVARATSLTATHRFLGNARFEAIGSIPTATDVDFYRIVQPAGTARVLTANVWSLSTNGFRPQVQVTTATGAVVPSEILVNDNGSFTVQAVNVVPGRAYLLRVSGATGSPAGNYFLTADAGKVATQVQTFASGSIGSVDRVDTLYVGETQQFHFALTPSGTGLPAGTRLEMTITNALGQVVFGLTAPIETTTSAPAVMLTPGEYQIRFRAIGLTMPNQRISFSLRGNRITDPVGPVIEDPTLVPNYRDPDQPGRFKYPGNFVSVNPYYWLVILL